VKALLIAAAGAALMSAQPNQPKWDSAEFMV
jgi:hypothetical protein